MIRLLPFAIADGPTNMARDEAMVQSAATGVASLRFYAWSPATLSLGYFQPAVARLHDPRLAELPWVRRPSGGATLVHDRELTYALALPADASWHTRENWLSRMHRIIQTALPQLHAVTHPCHRGDVLCFEQQTPGDLVGSLGKVVGSAQRKVRRCLLQHGSILLEQSPHTPSLPGIREQTGQVVDRDRLIDQILRAFTEETGWETRDGIWSSEEEGGIARLRDEKYGQAWWNGKR